MTQTTSDDSIPEHPPAGLLRRAAAILYDSVLVAALLFVASALVTIPVGLISGAQAASALATNPLFRLWLALVPMLFFVGFWRHGGQTLGMKTWGIRLVSRDGSPVSWSAAFLRLFAAILSWLPAGLGFLWALSDPGRRCWHDRLSHTYLVLNR